MKTCIYCGETKPLDEYHASDRAADGHRPECRACRTERAAFETEERRVVARYERYVRVFGDAPVRLRSGRVLDLDLDGWLVVS